MKILLTRYSSLVTNKRGISLIEVLISVVILSIGLLGVAMMQLTAITGNTFSREMILATEIGQDSLERTKAMAYADITITNLPVVMPSPVQPDPNNPGLSFTRTWAVTDNIPVTNTKTITVTIGWTDKNNTSRSVTVSTVKWNTSASP